MFTSLANVRPLAQLLEESPSVTEIAVTASDGASVVIKRKAYAQEAVSNAQVVEHTHVSVAGFDDIEQFEDAQDDRKYSIDATMVGIFHEANPALGKGDIVASGQIIGYIESMRLMNEVCAAQPGLVVDVAVSDGQPVQYAQPLIQLQS